MILKYTLIYTPYLNFRYGNVSVYVMANQIVLILKAYLMSSHHLMPEMYYVRFLEELS